MTWIGHGAMNRRKHGNELVSSEPVLKFYDPNTPMMPKYAQICFQLIQEVEVV